MFQWKTLCGKKDWKTASNDTAQFDWSDHGCLVLRSTQWLHHIYGRISLLLESSKMCLLHKENSSTEQTTQPIELVLLFKQEIYVQEVKKLADPLLQSLFFLFFPMSGNKH